jgi:2-oxoglutarate ferredoxin oxidoreductase subunit alpha
MDYSIKICGEAGQGIQTIGNTLAKVFARTGYHVFTHQDYESRIRGGNNFFQIRFSDRPVTSSRNSIDILVALDKASIGLYEGMLSEVGLVLYDSSISGVKYEKEHFLDVPFMKIAVDTGGSKVMANAAAVGAVLGMLGIDIEILKVIIKNAFKKKGKEVVDGNISTALDGHEFALKNCKKCAFTFKEPSEPMMLISGNEAIGYGAIASGCRFYSAYPMTPSTGIMLFLSGRSEKYGIVVEQAEDEIAAINMAIGASFAGVRSMTGTSGGGFALMVEGLSLTSMTETPVVIALAQRPGPATGLPTRTEQGDLLFAMYTAHGEFPRIIYAPGTPEQAFYLTNKAFDMAEKYQIPVIVMTDQYLADSQWTIKGLDFDRLCYRDYRLRGKKLVNMSEYRRHAFTDTGVSPLAVPGESHHLVVTDSDEHDEEGHIIEDAETRVRMVEKRLLRKLPHIRKEMEPPLFYGVERPDILLVGWGSTYGVMWEAVEDISKRRRVAMLHFSELYPLPEREKFDYVSLMENAEFSICVENNATGQFAKFLRSETGYEFKYRLNRYDGRPYVLEEMVDEIKRVVRNKK